MSLQRSLITFERITRTGIINFVRNAWLAIAAIAMITITLTIVLFLVIINATFINTIAQITDRIDVSVYLKDEVSELQKNSLITQLKTLDNVKSIHYVSKADALKIYQQQNRNDIDLLVAISQTDNPLPASLQIKPTGPNRLQAIKDFLEKPEIKELQSNVTSYSGIRKEAIDNITKATKFFRQAGIAGVIVFIVVSMLIIFNTIRMAIFNRRDELGIMRLLGATTWYIRGPFVVETVIYGILAALISVSICNLLFTISTSTLEANSLGYLDISYSSQYFSQHFWAIVSLQLVVGVTVGSVSSIIATRRYLKFKSQSD